MSVMRLSAKMDRTDGGTPWGFRMAGGKDFGSPLVVQKVTPGSLAAKCGLQVGDTIVRIGPTPADSLRHKDAQQRIVDSGNALELALERPGSGSSHADNYSYSQSSVSQMSYPPPGGTSYGAPSHNAGPKPFGDGYNSVSSLTSQTASFNLGSPHSGTVANDSSETAGMLHATNTVAVPSDVIDVTKSDVPEQSQIADNISPTPAHSSDTAAVAAANSSETSDADDKKPTRPPRASKPSVAPRPAPTQSAVYDDKSGEDGIPQYRGFQDPKSQSLTFKKLQNLIDSGEDVRSLTTQRAASPVRPATKPSVAAKPHTAPPAVKPSDVTESVVTCDSTVRQTDAGHEDTLDIVTERKTIVVAPRSQTKPSATAEPSTDGSTDTVKTYIPSETCRLVREQEAGIPSNVNPLTGVEKRDIQSKYLLPVSINTSLPQDETIDMPVERKKVVVPSDKSHSRSPASQSAPSAPRPGGGGAWQPKIPTGPRKMRVGKPGEAKNLPAVFGGARIPLCSACGTAIRGPFISALDKTWCPDHFICANPHCRVPLVNCGFVEEESQLYCEKDYEQYFAPRCGKCGRAIVGEVVNAMKNTFHMGCFLCCHCHQPIGTGSFHNEDGKIYCPKDWAVMFQTKCYGCQFPIEPGDRWVEALNQNWHSECFNCSTCQVNLEGQSFFAKGGKPYCKKHSAGGRY